MSTMTYTLPPAARAGAFAGCQAASADRRYGRRLDGAALHSAAWQRAVSWAETAPVGPTRAALDQYCDQFRAAYALWQGWGGYVPGSSAA